MSDFGWEVDVILDSPVRYKLCFFRSNVKIDDIGVPYIQLDIEWFSLHVARSLAFYLAGRVVLIECLTRLEVEVLIVQVESICRECHYIIQSSKLSNKY